MSYYIKVNRKVFDFLSLPNRPMQLPDGNYLLWQADMLAFGPLYMLQETCATIGAVALTPGQAAAEQRGLLVTPLPQATDPRFIMDEADTEADADDTAQPVDDAGEDSMETETEEEGGQL